MQYCLILKLRNYSILLFSIGLTPLSELAQRRSVLFLFQTNFFNWQCEVFAQFHDGSELKKEEPSVYLISLFKMVLMTRLSNTV